MGIQSMSCPRCGNRATEYDENKWKCLDCGTKFIYEPPPGVQPPPKIDVVLQQFDIQNMPKEGLIYKCKGFCGLNCSTLTKPAQNCPVCGAPVCSECYTKTQRGACKECTDRINHEAAEKARKEAEEYKLEKERADRAGRRGLIGCMTVVNMVGIPCLIYFQEKYVVVRGSFEAAFLKDVMHGRGLLPLLIGGAVLALDALVFWAMVVASENK